MTFNSASWESTLASLRRHARTRVAEGDVEDIVAETMLGLCEHHANKRPVRSWWGLAGAILRTNICRRLRRRVREELIAPAALEDIPQRERVAVAPERPVPLAGLGPLQRAIVERVVAGESVASIASALGRPAKAILRVVKLLTRKLSRDISGPD